MLGFFSDPINNKFQGIVLLYKYLLPKIVLRDEIPHRFSFQSFPKGEYIL